MEISHLLQNIKEPQTILMAKKSRALKAEGVAITDLSLGEPDFDTPAHIKAAAIDALQNGWTKYPPVAGYPDLKDAICVKLLRDNNLQYIPENIVVSTGAKQSLSNVINAIINEGDEVIIPTPFWVTYATQVQICGGIPIFIPCGIEDDFKLSAEKLEAAITPRTKAIIYSSPCNPSGAVYQAEELQALASILIKYENIIVISDEIYEYINFKGNHHSMAHIPDMKERTVIVNGFSKGYAMTGWRLGYIAAPIAIAKACELMQSQTTSGANAFVQKAAIVALTGDQSPTKEMVQAYKARRDYFINALQQIKGFEVNEPEGAFYAFVDISRYIGSNIEDYNIENSQDFAMYLLEKVHVTGVPGIAFGDDACIRFSFATSLENLELAIQKMTETFGKK